MDLSKLPIDIFIKEITYLPFNTVISVCNTNKKLHSYCTDSKYNNQWKNLIDDTFSSIDGYYDKLKDFWTKLKFSENTYNYLVYTQLIELLDPVTQLMIYYSQGDMDSFKNKRFEKVQRFLALFLLGKKDMIINYLPGEASYVRFYHLLNNREISQDDLDEMLILMIEGNSLKGVKLLHQKGANIHTDYGVKYASQNGYLDILKYLVENGGNVQHAFRDASDNGHLDLVKYLASKGANIHANNNYALTVAAQKGHLDVVKYLVSEGADIHDGSALIWGSYFGNLDAVKYLIESTNIRSQNKELLIRWANLGGNSNVVEYLESL